MNYLSSAIYFLASTPSQYLMPIAILQNHQTKEGNIEKITTLDPSIHICVDCS